MTKKKTSSRPATRTGSRPITGAASPKSTSASVAPAPPKRTPVMTAAIIYVIIHGLLWTAASWATARELTGNRPWYLGLLIAASAASIVAGVALWYWKRWGFYVYAVTAVAVAVLTLLFTGSSLIMLGSLLPVALVAYALYPKIASFT